MNPMQALMNPQAYAMQMLNQNPQLKNNPIMQNAISMAQSGDTNGLATIAQNLARTKGINLQQMMQQMGLKA